MSGNVKNKGDKSLTRKDVKIYGAAICAARDMKTPWRDICQRLGLNERTAHRYYDSYIEMLEDKPEVRDVIAQAAEDLTNLVGPAVQRYTKLIDSNDKTLQGHSLSASRDVLKTKDLIRDKHIVEGSLSNISNDDLATEFNKLVAAKREAASEDSE